MIRRYYCFYDWEFAGIPVQIAICPQWSETLNVMHIEVRSDVEQAQRRALPITETGYKSIFTHDLTDDLDSVFEWIKQEVHRASNQKPQWAQVDLFGGGDG